MLTKVTLNSPALSDRKKHTKPEVSKLAKEAEKIAKQMYSSLTVPDAPRATPRGYILGASIVLKMLIDQAVQQGEDKEELKGIAIKDIEII